MKKNLLFACILVTTLNSFGQEDLLEMLSGEMEEELNKKTFTTATFKTARLINGHSVEQPFKNDLLFIISHRFGRLNGGVQELFGLDQATIRIGFDYGITQRLSVGIGRSTYQKNYDGFIKYRIIRQATGKGGLPFSLVAISAIACNTLPWIDATRQNYFTSRLSFVNQLLIARKFNKSISVQIMPTHIHKNLVPLATHTNDIFAIGAGGRIKITERVSVNAEYFALLGKPATIPTINGQQPINSLALGFDIETGGHVFQLQFTNAQAMFEKGFITETNSSWQTGGIHFGFNVTRAFTLKKH